MFSQTAFYPVDVPLDRKWLHAQFHLGTRVVVHYVRKLWPWSPRFGLARFQENYVVEGLPPFSPDHRAFAHEAGRCTGCGACDDACPILAGTTAVAAVDFCGPAALVVSGARSATHLDDVGFALDVLTGPGCAACRACDRACPERVPVTALAAALDEQRKVVVAARAGALPVLADDVARLADAARATAATPSLTNTTSMTMTATSSAPSAQER